MKRQFSLLATDLAGERSVLFDNRIIAEKFLTEDELAAALNVSVHAIRKWRMQKRIPFHKFGRSVRFHVSEVLTSLKGERRK